MHVLMTCNNYYNNIIMYNIMHDVRSYIRFFYTFIKVSLIKTYLAALRSVNLGKDDHISIVL